MVLLFLCFVKCPTAIMHPTAVLLTGLQAGPAAPCPVLWSEPCTDTAVSFLCSLLGKACGDILGAAVEGAVAGQVAWLHPRGLCAYMETKRG